MDCYTPGFLQPLVLQISGRCKSLGVDVDAGGSHSKHNPSWNAMKITMLLSQLKLFINAGITTADVRMSYNDNTHTRKLQDIYQEIEELYQSGKEIGEGEVSIRPELPESWLG